MKYCVGYISSDEVHELGEDVLRCWCGNDQLLTAEEFDRQVERWQETVLAQLYGMRKTPVVRGVVCLASCKVDGNFQVYAGKVRSP